jgi:hypothetical protein
MLLTLLLSCDDPSPKVILPAKSRMVTPSTVRAVIFTDM